MSIGIAIYGIDAATPTQVLALGKTYFSDLGYAITGAGFHAPAIVHADEHPTAFSHDTPGLYEGQRRYEKSKLRMVYPKNFINADHLTLSIDGVLLRDWIRADAERGQLDQTSDAVWCWSVPTARLVAVNTACGKAGLLLAWKPVQAQPARRKLP